MNAGMLFCEDRDTALRDIRHFTDAGETLQVLQLGQSQARRESLIAFAACCR